MKANEVCILRGRNITPRSDYENYNVLQYVLLFNVSSCNVYTTSSVNVV